MQNTHTNSFINSHEHYMNLAISLAKQGVYTTRPNPAVGCVLVQVIDGKQTIIGKGFHAKAGQPHAEVHALADAKQQGFDTKGATAYVTLEPCAHTGKTPPCAYALVRAEVARVVIANHDPNPKVGGKGITILQEAGIEVITGVCDEKARKLNKGFLKTMAGGLPYVRLKIATSLDGKTAMQSGESKWITGSEARADVQHWRAISCAVVTGSGTVLADNPQLNVRSDLTLDEQTIPTASIPQPLRVVLDRRGQINQHNQANYTLCTDGKPTLLMGTGTNHVAYNNPEQALQYLQKQYDVQDVLLECGATLATAFLQAGLVDEIIHYQAPMLLGSTAQPMFSADIQQLANAQQFTILDVQRVGNDIRLNLGKCLP